MNRFTSSPIPLRSRHRPALVLSILTLVGLAVTLAGEAQPPPACPNPPVAKISAVLPDDVCIPAGFGGNPIAFFDDFSWRSFIALVWPVKTGERGVPATNLAVGGAGPKVFETYKATWEIFHRDGSAPSPWNTYESHQHNACDKSANFGDVVLASFSKFSDIGQAGVGNLVGPLVAQNRTYVRFLTGFNKIEFDQIATDSNKWYLRQNLPKTLTFENGAVDTKSAWLDMTGVGHPERYYTRTAWVMDPATGECAPKTVGLIGLHIVQKTPSRPQWIWSTFEHVDLVKQAGAVPPFALNDESGTPMPAQNPFPINPLILPPPVAFNVDRLKPIHASTVATNEAYRQILKPQGAVWQFYQLVMTQWPVPENQPSLPGTPANTFPGFPAGTNDTSAYANLTMETFDQKKVQEGCMNCHNFTRVATDFLWTLKTHAFPPNVPNLMFSDPSINGLRNLLEMSRPPGRQ